MLIVVTGKKRSGKDTLGDYLVQNHGFTKTPALADPSRRWRVSGLDGTTDT